MDCTTFQENEIDALYGELDATAAAATAEHSATCSACAARLERLRGTRNLVLSVAVGGVPSDFEARIMSAVDARLSAKASAPAPARAPTGVAQIFRFMARPSFAVAAAFVLILGGATLVMQTTASEKRAPLSARNPSAPAFQAAGTSLNPDEGNGGSTAASAAAQPAAVAQNDFDPSAPPVAATAAASPAPMATGAAKLAQRTGGQAGSEDAAFLAARTLYDAGRYEEALPKFEAIKGRVPEAELYAARCIANTRGCAAAAPRFDAAATRNAGTEAAARATIEGAKCYQSTGNVVAARKRLVSAKNEPWDSNYLNEASQALESLDRGGAGGAAGGPGAGVHASPKAAAPAPAAPSKSMRPNAK